MDALITHFRRGRNTQHSSQMLIMVPNTATRAAAQKLVGKVVVWESPSKKQIKGVVLAPHGNKGIVRAKFETGMPGQAIASKVTIQ